MGAGATVGITRNGDVAVLTIDNPPVNAMSHAVRAPLADAIAELASDPAVAGIVISCAGRTFVAGADISEFGKPPQPPSLPDIVALLDTVTKPTLAAIHGTALGGGLELALACHYRVAVSDSRLGLPEVKLGLLPGAGGTVRLPRLVGPHKALAMIASGTPVSAKEALEDGLVDALSDGELVGDAIAFLRGRIAQAAPIVPVSARNHRLAADMAAFNAKAAEIALRAKGLDAPVACIGALRNAVSLPFAEAQAAERALFERLVAGDQSRAQRHLFFAEREAAKVPGIGKGVVSRSVTRVGIVGAGTMGGSIAMAFANSDLPVTVVEMGEDALGRGLAAVRRNYDASVKRGSIDVGDMAARLDLIHGTTDYAELADADLIIEAAFEDMEVKRQIFRRLDAVARPGAVLATNTSYLDVDKIAAATARPGDVLGLHFFSPANVMRLLEVVRGRETAPDVVATALAIARRLGKVPVVIGVCHGFVGNRMLRVRNAQNEALLLEGATPEQVDRVFREFGWSMGPFQVSDLAGLDISWRMRKARGETAPVGDALCEAGRLGQKTGAGYYRYADGDRTARPDDAVTELIERTSRELGIERRQIGAEEIIERTHLPLVNEGARILEEGIAQRASDIDVVWTSGYGFPIGKGGPMFWAEQIEGRAKVLEGLRRWHERTGNAVFDPAKLLQEPQSDSAS